jgi:PPOX class probable F420-dependent enzyme
MSLAMSVAEREQFLAGMHVGILSVVLGDGRGPLTMPVWYGYQPGGEVHVITERDSRKVGAVRAAGRMTLCAQDETPPYRYVSVEGPVAIENVDPADRRVMARRYLGTEGGDQYVATNPDAAGTNILLRLSPEHWLTADFGKQLG